MKKKRLYAYNRVAAPGDSIDGMLFTDKELKNTCKYHPHFFDGAKIEKVKVYNTDIYYFFGRFADKYRLVEA